MYEIFPINTRNEGFLIVEFLIIFFFVIYKRLQMQLKLLPLNIHMTDVLPVCKVFSTKWLTDLAFHHLILSFVVLGSSIAHVLFVVMDWDLI